jgi:hypothetical protein
MMDDEAEGGKSVQESSYLYLTAVKEKYSAWYVYIIHSFIYACMQADLVSNEERTNQ